MQRNTGYFPTESLEPSGNRLFSRSALNEGYLFRGSLKQFRSLTPRPVVHDFEALTRWWLDNPNPLTYQQALGMSDDLYHHFLSHPLISEDDALRLARKGLVTESEYNDLQLWYFNGHTMSCWFGPLGVDGTGSLYGLTFDYQTASPTKTQFYLLDDYYRVMNHLTE